MLQKRPRWVTYVFLTLGVFVIAFPMFLTVITPFKTQQEISQNFFALPSSLYLGNFQNILERGEYLQTVLNTIFITGVGCAGVVLIVPMVSYAIARNMNKAYYKYLYFFLLLGIFVPFQVKMMPLVKIMSNLNMLSVQGITIVYIASEVCEGVFLYVAFTMGIPTDLEEAAYIDGASTLHTYARIIFPLLKPMTITVLIRDGLAFWNDFFLPLLVLNKTPENWTLTLFQYNFKTVHTVNYAMSFAAFLLSMLPVMVIYVFLQKHIIGGLINGAVKG